MTNDTMRAFQISHNKTKLKDAMTSNISFCYEEDDVKKVVQMMSNEMMPQLFNP